MSTSQTSFLSKPTTDKKIELEALAYMRSRAKRRAYNLVIKEFKKSGISKAELARRLGKGADRVSRMLGGPGNWTIATVSDLLFAISASEPSWDLAYPLDRPVRNDKRPHWLDDQPAKGPLLTKASSGEPDANSAPSLVVLSNLQTFPSSNGAALQLGLSNSVMDR